MTEQCKHDTSKVLFGQDLLHVCRCTYLCGSLFITIRDDDGISHQFDLPELAALREENAILDASNRVNLQMAEKLTAERDALRERVRELEAARKWLDHIYSNAHLGRMLGGDFQYFFEPDEILAIEAVLYATAEGGQRCDNEACQMPATQTVNRVPVCDECAAALAEGANQ